VCLGFVAECLDLLWLFVVEMGELTSRFAIRPQQLVQLRVYGLSVPVFGPLDEQVINSVAIVATVSSPNLIMLRQAGIASSHL
jgi:hypothetical protein